MAVVEQLVGRDEQVAALSDVLGSRERLPSTVLLAGEAGIGKTALWLAGVEQAEAAGFTVLACRPSEAETGYSFAGLTDLLGGVVEAVLPELPALQQRALEVALLLADSEGHADERVISAAFLSALRSASRTQALLIAVDDVQWLDRSLGLGSVRDQLPGVPWGWLRRLIEASRRTRCTRLASPSIVS